MHLRYKQIPLTVEISDFAPLQTCTPISKLTTNIWNHGIYKIMYFYSEFRMHLPGAGADIFVRYMEFAPNIASLSTTLVLRIRIRTSRKNRIRPTRKPDPVPDLTPNKCCKEIYFIGMFRLDPDPSL